MNIKINNKVSLSNLKKNYKCIRNWFSLKNSSSKDEFLNVIKNWIEVVVLIVDELSSAFQLFDSQNTRGKVLDPHDLLKAYHLREMRNEPYEMHHAVSKWESFKPSDIKNLFDVYLFSILNWSKKKKLKHFLQNLLITIREFQRTQVIPMLKEPEKLILIFKLPSLLHQEKIFLIW